jgi:hypothetical protein
MIRMTRKSFHPPDSGDLTPLHRRGGRGLARAILVAALHLITALLLVACGAGGESELSPACPPGVGRGMWDLDLPWSEEDRSVGGATGRLLDDPDFGATPEAARDLEAGVVDERLVATLRTMTELHRVCVDAFKEGHYFEPGVPDGPRIPEGYGEAGGLPNTHYFGRAADVWWVDGMPVEGNATAPEVLDVGRTLAGIPARRRPDQIIGPASWSNFLGYGRERGWVLERDQLELHADHIHLGYIDERGTRNAR